MVAQQIGEQLELGDRQSDLLARAVDLAAEQVELDARRCASTLDEACATTRSCARMRATSSASENGLTR